VADPAASRIVRASLERFVSASARQRAALAKLLGLLDSDIVALEHVLRAGELSAVALARRMPLSSGGTAAVIDRLCTAGLVSRTRDPQDRRRVVLRATPGVEQRLGELLAPLVADVDAATRELSATQRAVVERFLACLADVCERHADRMLTAAEAAARAGVEVPSPVLWG
jgi:DNA-binding MarR family transcriptional regulator